MGADSREVASESWQCWDDPFSFQAQENPYLEAGNVPDDPEITQSALCASPVPGCSPLLLLQSPQDRGSSLQHRVITLPQVPLTLQSS